MSSPGTRRRGRGPSRKQRGRQLLLQQTREEPRRRRRHLQVEQTREEPRRRPALRRRNDYLRIIINADATYIKMVSEQFDRCHGILLQYAEFLSSALTPATYVQLIPRLEDLVHQYHIEPEVCRVLKVYHASSKESTRTAGRMSPESRIEEALGSCLLPSLQLIPANPAVDIEIWGVLSLLPYEVRYRLYGEWEKDTEQNRVVLAARQTAKLDTRRLLKRLAKKNLKQLGRMVAKLAHANLMTVLRTIVQQVEAYRDMINPVVDAFKYLTQVCRVLKVYHASSKESTRTAGRMSPESRIEEALGSCLLPSLQLIPANPAVDMEIWRVLSLLPYEVAFLIYRPVMRLFKSANGGEACWPLDGNEEGESVSSDDMILLVDSSQKQIMTAANGSLVDEGPPGVCKCCLLVHNNPSNFVDLGGGVMGSRGFHSSFRATQSGLSLYIDFCPTMIVKPGPVVVFLLANQKIDHRNKINWGKVHWKWSGRITKVLNQCMESKEYMEIRNALILLTKITSTFPALRKNGIDIEKRVAKLRGDEREDLKVLATGVAAALAARKSSWLSEEEFGMGHLHPKPVPAKTITGNQSADPATTNDHSVRAKSTEGRHERSENAMKPDAQHKKNASTANGSDSQIPSSSAQGQISGVAHGADEPPKLLSDEGVKVLKPTAESETRGPQKRVAHNAAKVSKHDAGEEDAKPGKSTSWIFNQLASTDREVLSQAADGVLDTKTTSSLVGTNGNVHLAPRKVSLSSQRSAVLAANLGGTTSPAVEGESADLIDSTVKQQKRSVPIEEQERTGKRRKGESYGRDGDLTEHHTDKEKKLDSRSVDKLRSLDHERGASEEQNVVRTEKSREKFDEKYDRDPREKADRTERRCGEDVVERPTDRSFERRERSIERMQDRGIDRVPEKGREDRNKEERNKIKHAESSIDRVHTSDERFRGQSLPPPPPLPTSFVPQSIVANRRDEDSDCRGGSTKHTQKSSPRRDEKEQCHLEENASLSQDDGKHRREDLRDRKREDRDGSSSKVHDRDRDKGTMKEDSDPNSASKRRKLKREQSTLETGEYAPSAPQPPSVGASNSQSEIQEGERKGAVSQHWPSHADELPRMHTKDSTSKTCRREAVHPGSGNLSSSSVLNSPNSTAHATEDSNLTVQVEFLNLYFEAPVDKNSMLSSAISFALLSKGITETDCYYSCNLEYYNGTEIIKSTGIKVGSVVHVHPRMRGGSKGSKGKKRPRVEMANQNKKLQLIDRVNIVDYIELLKSKKHPLWFEKVAVPTEMWWSGLPYEVQLAVDGSKTLSQILHCLESLHERGYCLDGKFSPDHLFYNRNLGAVEIVNDATMSKSTPMGLFLDYSVIAQVVREHFTYLRFNILQFPMFVEQFLTDIANIPTKPHLCSNSVSRSALSRPFCVWTSSERMNVYTDAIIHAKATNRLFCALNKKLEYDWTKDFVNVKRVPAVWAARFGYEIDGIPKKYVGTLYSQTDFARCLISHSKLPVKVLDAAIYKKWGALLGDIRDKIIKVLTKNQPPPEKTPNVPDKSAQQVKQYDSIPTSNNTGLGLVIGLKN